MMKQGVYVIWLMLSVLILITACAQTPGVSGGNSPHPPGQQQTATPVKPFLQKDFDDYQKAKAMMAKQDYAAAEAILRNLVNKHPGLAAAWANLGVIYRDTHRLEQAEKALVKATEAKAKSPDVYVQLAIVYRQQGKIEQAAAANAKALELNPDHMDANYNQAILYDLYLDQADKAVIYLEKYLASPGDEDKKAQVWLQQLKRRQQKRMNASVN